MLLNMTPSQTVFSRSSVPPNRGAKTQLSTWSRHFWGQPQKIGTKSEHTFHFLYQPVLWSFQSWKQG